MRNLLFVMLLAGACSRPATNALPPKEAKELLVNRSWVDRLPQRSDDKLHVFRFTPSMGGGVYQDRTLFAGQFELFTFEQDGSRIRTSPSPSCSTRTFPSPDGTSPRRRPTAATSAAPSSPRSASRKYARSGPAAGQPLRTPAEVGQPRVRRQAVH